MRLVLVLLVLLSGCSNGGGTAIHYYLIDARDQVRLPEGSALVVEIVDLQIPQYLERFQIASRFGENQLVFSDTHQWGENLRKNLTRTLGINLSRLLGTMDIGTPINRTASEPDYRVQVYIAQFERDARGTVQLLARYQITPRTGGQVLITEGVKLSGERDHSGDFAATVTSMADLFSQLAMRIAESIIRLEKAA